MCSSYIMHRPEDWLLEQDEIVLLLPPIKHRGYFVSTAAWEICV